MATPWGCSWNMIFPASSARNVTFSPVSPNFCWQLSIYTFDPKSAKKVTFDEHSGKKTSKKWQKLRFTWELRPEIWGPSDFSLYREVRRLKTRNKGKKCSKFSIKKTSKKAEKPLFYYHFGTGVGGTPPPLDRGWRKPQAMGSGNLRYRTRMTSNKKTRGGATNSESAHAKIYQTRKKCLTGQSLEPLIRERTPESGVRGRKVAITPMGRKIWRKLCPRTKKCRFDRFPTFVLLQPSTRLFRPRTQLSPTFAKLSNFPRFCQKIWDRELFPSWNFSSFEFPSFKFSSFNFSSFKFPSFNFSSFNFHVSSFKFQLFSTQVSTFKFQLSRFKFSSFNFSSFNFPSFNFFVKVCQVFNFSSFNSKFTTFQVFDQLSLFSKLFTFFTFFAKLSLFSLFSRNFNFWMKTMTFKITLRPTALR